MSDKGQESKRESAVGKTYMRQLIFRSLILVIRFSQPKPMHESNAKRDVSMGNKKLRFLTRYHCTREDTMNCAGNAHHIYYKKTTSNLLATFQ